jgi:hypothetical protein
MSRTRTLVASAVASLALFAVAEPAHAFQPIKGTTAVGPNYSKSVSSGDFGAGFQIYGQARARDYAKLCTSTKPSYQCAGQTGFPQIICNAVFTSVNAQMCAQHGMGFDAGGKAATDVTLFGKDIDLFDIGASADAEPSAATAEYHVIVAGLKLAGQNKTAGFSGTKSLGERTLVKASSTFMIGPVPLTVEADATGSLGIDYALTVGTSSVSGSAGPSVGIDGVFSAGLGVSGLSAGIEGDLTLVNLSTPATASVAWQGGDNFSYDASLDLTIHALDGSVSVYGQAGPFKATYQIFSWDGLTYTKNLGHQGGTFAL